MRSAKVKFHCFRVRKFDKAQPSLKKLSKKMVDLVQNGATLKKRGEMIGGRRVRLEDARFDQDSGLTLLNFSGFRVGPGPGKGSDNQPVTGFDMQADERFAEDTAIAYHAESKHLMIQYNHHGPRIGKISTFFDRRGGTYDFQPVFAGDVASRIKNASIYRSLEVGVTVDSISKQDLADNMPLGNAIRDAKKAGSRTANITLSIGLADPHEGLDAGIVGKTIGWLQRQMKRDPESIRTAVVRAKPSVDENIDAIDLVAERLCENLSLPIGPDQRISVEDRFDALVSLKTTWTDVLK